MLGESTLTIQQDSTMLKIASYSRELLAAKINTHTHTHKKSTSTHQQVRIYVINVGYSHDSNNCRDLLTYNIGIILGSSASYLESLFVLEASAALLSSVTHFVHVNMKL